MALSLRALVGALLVSMLCWQAARAQQINVTSVTPNPVCAGATITATYSYTQSGQGIVTLFLSGPNTSNVQIGSAATNGGPGSVTGVIPPDRSGGAYTVSITRVSIPSGTVVNSPNSSPFTVNALPAAPVVASLSYCVGATGVPPLTATGQNLKWYNVSTGGVGTTVAPTPSTSATGTTNYYVSQTSAAGCEGPRATLAVTINPRPAKPTVVSSVSYCQNSTAHSLASSVTSGSTLKWYAAQTGGTGTTVAPIPSTSSLTPVTYYVSQTDGNGCESDRAAITVTIKPNPAAPAVTTPVIYCQGQTATSLSATAVSGGSLNWYGPSNNSLGSTAPTPPTNSPGSTFYLVSQTVGGCTSATATITVTVNPKPAAPTTKPVDVCQGTTPVSLATGVTSGTNLRWYTTSSGGTASTVAPTPSTGSVGSTPYYVSQINANGCESDRAVITYTVNAYPPAPTVSPGSLTYCQNSTAVPLTATGAPNATLNYYMVATGGTPSSSLTPLTNQSNNYYVSQTLNGCESQQRATISVAINALPASPAVTTPVTYCQSTIVAAPLSATASTNNTLSWYGTNAQGGTAMTVAPTPLRTTDGTFIYYVSQKDPFGCESPRAPISVIIYPTPAAPTITVQPSACLNTVPAPLAQSVTATGTLKWYTASTGGTGSTVAPTLSTTAVGSTLYYVSQTNANECESDRAQITFTVNRLPAAPVPTPTALLYCQNATAQPLTATGQNLKWYLQSSGGSPLPSPVIPSTALAGPAVTYYVTQTNANGCESARASVTVTTVSRPAAPTVSTVPVTYCQFATPVSLTATPITGNTLSWYGTSATGGTASATATVPTTDPPGTKLYYVSQTDGNGCESSSRASIPVTVYAKPTAPTVTSITLCQNAPTVALATAVSSGTSLTWYTDPTTGTGSTVAPTLSTTAVGTTTYYVSQTSANNCESDRSAIPVTVKPLPVAPTITQNTQNLCQSSVPTPLTAIATGTLQWYSPDGRISPSVTPLTNAVGPTSYSVSQIVDGCEGPKATLNVVVIPKPVAPTVTSSLTICQAAPTITLSATGQNLKWYTDPTGGTPSTTAPTPPTTDSGIKSYYVTQTDANGCESDRASILFNVKPKPAPPGTADISFCSNQVMPLTATFAAGTSPNWYGTSEKGGTAMSTAPVPSTAVIGQAVPYYVSQTLNGCESERASIPVMIKALPVAPTVSSTPVTYCQDATALPLSATATNGGSLNWYTTQTGGVASSTALTPSTSSSLPPTTYYYVSQTVNGCEGPRASIAVTINPKPAKPTVTSSLTYCQNTTAPALTATGVSGNTLNWYTVPTSGTAIPTPTPLTTTPGPTVYYVSQTDGKTCESDRASITVNVIAKPGAPGVSSLSLCLNSTASSLTATPATGGSLNWYGTNATGGTGNTVAPTPVTSTTGTVTYYVSQSVNGCEGPRAGLDVTIKPLPAAPVASVTSFSYCQNAVATPLAATASAGGTLNWYISQGGVVSPLGQATPTPSTTIAGTFTYYVSQSVNDCEGPKTTITVTISPRLPKPTVVSSLTYCQSTTAPATAPPLTATGTGTLRWYNDPTITTSIPTPTPSTATPGPTVYYVSQTDANGCESDRASITVTITATPSLPGVTSLSLCQNAAAPALTASTSPGGSLNWYGTNATGGTASPFPPVLSTSMATTVPITYYVSQSVSGCEGPRASLDVTIKPLPAAPTVTNSTPSFCQNSVATALSATPATGGTLNWYINQGGVLSPLGQVAPTPSTATTVPTTYAVSQSVNGCEGPTASIVVTIKALPAAPTVSASSVTFCQGTNATPLTAVVSPGGTLNWYTTATGGVSSPFAPVPPTDTPGLITYYVSQSVTDCESPRVPIVVIIKRTPSAPTVGPSPIYCQGGTATALSAVAPDGGSLNWYTQPTGGTPSPTPPVPPVNTVGVVTYYVSQSLDGCESATRVSLTADIKAAPVAPFATPSIAYCQGATAVPLTATPAGSDILNWYSAPTGGSGSTLAPTPSTSAPGSTPFYVSQTDANGCESVRSVVTVKVNALPVVPSTVPVTYCQGSPTTPLTAILTGGVSLNWYTAAAGGVASPVAPTIVSTSPGSTPYYVSQTDANGCESDRNVVLVTITAAPAAPVVAAIAPVCQNDPSFAVQAAGENLKWYTDPTTTASLGSAVIQSTAQPGTFIYYVSQTVNSCEGARAQAQVVVNALPAAPIVANLTGCQDAVVQPLTATGTLLQWYDVNDNLIAAPTPVTKVDVAQTYTYKVTQTLNGCASPKATFAYTVNVTPLPTVVPVAAYCQNSLINNPLQATGSNLKWTDPTGVVSANAPIPSTIAVTSGSSYFVTQTSALGCESRPAEIKVAVNAQATAKLEGNASVYLGSPALLTLTLTGAGPYSYTLSDGTSGIAETSATSPITTKQVSVTPAATTTYTIAAISNACGVGPSSGAATVTVKAPTVTTLGVSASSVCTGTAFTVSFSTTGEFVTGNAFTVEIANTVGDSASRKYIPISNGVVTGPFITTTIPATIAPGQYYVRVVASNAPYPIVGTISPVVLTVRPLPTASFSVSKKAIYKGESVVLVFSLGGDGPWTGTYLAGAESTVFGATASVYSATLTPATTTTYKLMAITSNNGCGPGKIEGVDTVTVRVDILTAEEDLLSNSVKVYPVPTDGAVTVDIDLPLQSKPAQLRLVSPGGLVTEQLTTKKRQTVLDMSKEPAGTYLLYITVGDRSTVRKILKW